MPLPAFRFKKFSVEQNGAAHPVGTDAVLLGAWADVNGATRFLDIGTGTGVVALMLAQRLYSSGDFSRSNTARKTSKPSGAESSVPNWAGVGVEIHPVSAALARGNFAASPWAGKLDVWEGSIQNFAKKVGLQALAELPESLELSGSLLSYKPFGLIVSNPPFFSELTISPDETRRLGRHTASLSPGDLLEAVVKLLRGNDTSRASAVVAQTARFGYGFLHGNTTERFDGVNPDFGEGVLRHFVICCLAHPLPETSHHHSGFQVFLLRETLAGQPPFSPLFLSTKTTGRCG